MAYRLLIVVSKVQGLDPWQLSDPLEILAFSIASLSFKLLLLLSQLLVHLKQRYLKEAVETSLLESRHDPLYDNVNFFLLIGRGHLELLHDKGLLLFEVVLLIFFFENASLLCILIAYQ